MRCSDGQRLAIGAPPPVRSEAWGADSEHAVTALRRASREPDRADQQISHFPPRDAARGDTNSIFFFFSYIIHLVTLVTLLVTCSSILHPVPLRALAPPLPASLFSLYLI